LLFTANVAIWVEGPSDMIFWREALKLHDLGKTFVEGFDYTFLMYGGKCISHLTAMETNQKLNILSVSSHPIFIVDSDISVNEHFLNPENNLKTAAKDIMDQFNNDTREPGNSLFLFSLAREMENYITADAIKYAIKKVAVSITDEELTLANISNDDWPKVEKYHDMIERKFNVANIGSRNDDGVFSAKGHTRWGESNKTEVIKNAMEMPNLSLSDFKYGSVEQIEKIVMFIKRWQV